MSTGFSRIRVEETPPTPAVELVTPTLQPSLVEVQADLLRWRTMAIQTGERLSYAENQLKDLRQAADDARARFSKYKGRLDSANERVNDLQAQLVAAHAELDATKATLAAEQETARARLADQDVVKRKVWEIREQMLNGPLFDLFGEFCK